MYDPADALSIDDDAIGRAQVFDVATTKVNEEPRMTTRNVGRRERYITVVRPTDNQLACLQSVDTDRASIELLDRDALAHAGGGRLRR